MQVKHIGTGLNIRSTNYDKYKQSAQAKPVPVSARQKSPINKTRPITAGLYSKIEPYSKYSAFKKKTTIDLGKAKQGRTSPMMKTPKVSKPVEIKKTSDYYETQVTQKAQAESGL